MEYRKIEELYIDIKRISAEYLINQKRNNVERIKKIIPQIEEFVMWFMQNNSLQLETELYNSACQEMLIILQDILNAIQENDKVLLHDAICYGMIEYLECFMPELVED